MRTIVALALLLGGCKSDQNVVELTGSDTWYQEPTNQVDILWVVDNSHSMQPHQDNVAEGFAQFIEEIEFTDTDFRLGVITTSFDYDDPDRGKLIGDPPVITRDDDYLNLFRDRVHVGTGGSDKEKGLEATAYALSATMTTGANAGFLREDAFLLIVFVSDENDCSDDGALNNMSAEACYDNDELLVPVTEFVFALTDLKDDPSMIQIGAIVGPEVSEGCLDAKPGFRYFDVAALMGGVVGNICSTEYDSIMYDLGLNATGVRSTFQLSDPAKEGTLEVFVNEIIVNEDPTQINGWTYDYDTNYLTFWGDSVPERGSTITVNYTIQSGG